MVELESTSDVPSEASAGELIELSDEASESSPIDPPTLAESASGRLMLREESTAWSSVDRRAGSFDSLVALLCALRPYSTCAPKALPPAIAAASAIIDAANTL